MHITAIFSLFTGAALAAAQNVEQGDLRSRSTTLQTVGVEEDVGAAVGAVSGVEGRAIPAADDLQGSSVVPAGVESMSGMREGDGVETMVDERGIPPAIWGTEGVQERGIPTAVWNALPETNAVPAAMPIPTGMAAAVAPGKKTTTPDVYVTTFPFAGKTATVCFIKDYPVGCVASTKTRSTKRHRHTSTEDPNGTSVVPAQTPALSTMATVVIAERDVEIPPQVMGSYDHVMERGIPTAIWNTGDLDETPLVPATTPAPTSMTTVLVSERDIPPQLMGSYDVVKARGIIPPHVHIPKPWATSLATVPVEDMLEDEEYAATVTEVVPTPALAKRGGIFPHAPMWHGVLPPPWVARSLVTGDLEGEEEDSATSTVDGPTTSTA